MDHEARTVWTDDRIADRFRYLEDQMKDVEDVVDALERIPAQVAQNMTRLEAFAEKLDDYKGWIGDIERRLASGFQTELASTNQRIDAVAKSCAAISEAQREEQDRRKHETDERAASRRQITIAAISASAAIIAALIGALTLLIVNGVLGGKHR